MASTCALLVVCLCLSLFALQSHAQTFSASCSNLTSVNQEEVLTVVLVGYNPATGPVTVNIIPSSSKVITSNPNFLTFTSDSSLSTTLTGVGAGIAGISFSASVPGYSLPSVQNVYVFLNVFLGGDETIYPGTSVQGSVTLDASPANQLTVTLVSDGTVTFSPPSLVFVAGAMPYSQIYTATSLQPGAHTIQPQLSGPDAAFANPPSSVTLFVANRQVYLETPSSSYLNLDVGQQSGRVLVYIDVPPDISLTVSISTSDPSVSVSPASFTFTNGVLSGTFVVTGSKAGFYSISLGLSGPDSAKYSSNVLSVGVTISNRIINVPTSIPSIVAGTPSTLLTAYIATPPPTTLFLTPSGTGLTFTPPSLSFGPGDLVATFTITASTTALGSVQITYVLSGDSGPLYVVPSPSFVTVATTLRSVVPFFSQSLSAFPANVLVPSYLSLDVPTPTSFSVQLQGTNLIFTPSTFTFQSGVATLQQEFTVNATALGSTHISFIITGTDASLVNPIGSLTVSVVQKTSPVLQVPSSISVGVSASGTVTASSLLTSTLIVTLSATPSGAATFSPSVLTLLPGTQSAAFNIIATTVGSIVVQATLSGPGAPFNGNVLPVGVAVVQDQIMANAIFTNLVIGIPFEGLKVSLQQVSSTPVVVTPSSSLLQFTPSSVLFNGNSTACITITPIAASTVASIITFTVNDTVNFIAPTPVSIPPIALRTITVTYSISTLVVGIAAGPFVVTLSEPPVNTLVITPGSSTLSFNPPTLTFTPTSPSLSFTITPTNSQLADISWVLSGTDTALYSPPAQILNLAVNQRSVIVPTNLDTAIVGYPSKPILVTTDYPPVVSLTITPSCPGLLFSPLSLQLVPGAGFSSFTATLTSWQTYPGNATTQSFTILYSLSGPDAANYSLSATSTTLAVRQSMIFVTPPSTLQYDIPSLLYTITLERPVVNTLTLSICAPAAVQLQPSTIVFTPGYVSQQFSVLASSSAVVAPAPSTAFVSWQLGGASQAFYVAPIPFSVSLSTHNTIGVYGLATSYTLGGSDTFEVAAPNLNFAFSNFTLTPSANTMTFTPSQVTFSPLRLRFFFLVSANQMLKVSGAPFSDHISFALSGPDLAKFSAPASVPVTISKITVTVSYPILTTVGAYKTGTISLGQSPTTSLTLSATATAGLYISPNSFTFGPNDALFHFIIYSTTTATTSITWLASGPDGAYYALPGPGSYAGLSLRTVTSTSLVQVSPDGTSSSAVVVSLSSAPVNGLTVTPILPSGFQSSRILKFLPGQASLAYTLSVNNSADTVVSGYFNIPYALSGPDSDWYTVSSVLTVTIEQGSFNFNMLPTTVGTPYVTDVTLTVVPPNGITLIPSAEGVTFYPPQLQFNQSTLVVTLYMTPLYVGRIPISWTTQGPDVWIYQVPDAVTLISNARTFFYELSDTELTVGIPYIGAFYISDPPPTGVTLALIAPCLVFTPNSMLTYTPSITALQVIYTPSVTCQDGGSLYGLLQGPDAGWYTSPFVNYTHLTVARRSVLLDVESVQVTAGIQSPPITITIQLPGSLTLVPSAPGCTFSPPVFQFSSTVPSLPFTILCLTAGPSASSSVEVVASYAISGSDSDLYEVASFSISIFANMITVPSGPLPATSGVPYTYSISLDYLPLYPITVVPYSSTFIFNPPSITFSNSLYETLTITSTTPTATQLYVYYNVSSPMQEGIALSNPSTKVSSVPNEFYTSINFFEIAVGATSDILTYVADPPPNGVSLTPSSPTCKFSPPTMTFTPLNPTALVTFTCSSPGTAYVLYIVSGQDAIHYIVPSPDAVFVLQRTITPSVFDTVVVFQPNLAYISLDEPTEKGLTITPSAPGFTFSPSSFVFSNGSSVVSFTYTATQLTGTQSSPLTFALSGNDAAWYSPPGEIDIQVALKTIQVLSEYTTDTALIAGTPTNVYTITLDYPPESQLIVTPYGAGLTFIPSSLVFGEGVTGVAFSIQANVEGEDLSVFYSVSGWDAPYYALDTFSSTITTSLIFIELVYNADVTAGVLSSPVVIVASNSPSLPVTLQLTGSDKLYSVPSVTLGPTTANAVFQFTPLFVGNGSISIVVSGAGVNQFERTIWNFPVTAAARTFLVPTTFPDLFASVPSSVISVGVKNPPPTGVTLIPHAPNAVFSPSTLNFTSSTYHLEFTITANLPAAQNMVPSDFNFAHSITWEVTGTDAAWFEEPNLVQFNALPRDLTLISPLSNQIYVNVPAILTITSTYAATQNLTIIPRGAFIFNPPVLTMLTGTRSVSFSVTAVTDGSYSIRFALAGPDAAFYETLPNYNFIVAKWHFELPNFAGGLQYDMWNTPLSIRPFIVPPTGVTLTLTSDYLDFTPSTLNFTNASPSAEFSTRLKGLGYLREDGEFTVSFWVGGTDANLFNTPDDVSISWAVDPTRSLTISNFPSSLVVGVESAPIVIAIPNYPLKNLVLTPYATSTDIVFSPSSITLTRTSSSLTSSFTITVTHPSASVDVNIAISGPDAIYYSTTVSGNTIQILRRTFILPNFPNLEVGTESTPLAVALPYPTPQRVTLSFSSPSIVVNPSVLTFLPNQSSVPFTLTGGTVGSSVPLYVWVSGEDADLYDDVGPIDPILIASRTWTNAPDSVSITPGKATTVLFSVSTPPNTNITLTPFASGITFSPATLTIASPASSGSFSAWGNVGGTTATVVTVLGGPDALLYDVIPDYTASVNFLSVTSQQGLMGASTIQIGEPNAVVFAVSASPPHGLSLTPSAQGLTFNPPMLNFTPGVLFAHATFYGNTPGATQVTYTLSGPDRLLYQIDSSIAASIVTISPLYLSTGDVAQIVVGSTSGASAFLSSGSSGSQLAPPLPVTVTFVTSPPNAVTVYPPNVTLIAPASSFEVQFQPNIFSDSIFVQPVLSGPGAVYYSDPSAIQLTSVKRDFVLSGFINYLVNPATAQLTIGEQAGPFGVTARSVPTGVSLYLSAPGVLFIPSVLRFTGTFETLYFEMIPLQAIQTYVTFGVGGPDAQLFEVPDPSPLIRITHDFNIPPLPSVIVGQTSAPLTVSVDSVITSPVILTPTAECVTFEPPFLLFTPNMSLQTFTFAGTCVNYNLGENINPVVTVTQNSRFKYSNPPSYTPVTWNVREVGEQDDYALSLPQLFGTQAVNIVPATFKVIFSHLEIGSDAGFVNISVSVPPHSDVVLTLVANNLNFDPPYASFTHRGTTTLSLAIKIVHADYKDSQNIPFTVDYIVSGSNWQDFIPPAQTFIGVQQGNAKIIGGICASPASHLLPVSLWSLALMLMYILL